MNELEIINGYINETSWRVKANANTNRSFSGMQSHVSGNILAKDAIKKFGVIGKRHVDGMYYVHDLSGGVYSPYCSGNDLLNLLQKGLINTGGVSAKPAKHFSTALDQVSNFIYLMTGEFQGAQAFSNIDILLAPYVCNDKLNYEQVKQEIQQLVWNLSFNTRPGFQSPFTNLTFGLRPSNYYKNLTPSIGNKILYDSTYDDYQDEIDLINEAFLDIMIDGPGDNKPFTFPLPTYNITKDFDWNSDISNKIFECASKWGLPYFSNYVNTDLSEEDSLSMCCRLKLDTSQIQKVTGGIWNFGSNTGSLAVFTLNMSRIGYLSNGNDKKFFKILDNNLEDGKKYLLMKKEYIKKGVKLGLYPMISEYVGSKLFQTYFLTIGINGLNECSMNFCEQNILENMKWCDMVLKHIKSRVLNFQIETGHLFNFEATPAESASYSLAKIDKEKFNDIYTQGIDNEVYYTGSSLIPSNMDINILDALEHQDILQSNYTGGTIFHIDLGEFGSSGAVKELIKNVCKNTSLPYITWSPSYSICPIHGKTGGKGCCDKAEVYSRVVGYIRPVFKWNMGKRAEFKNKKFFRK
ncbi:ribonucleoside triphosphate reductase [Patescibacteria group bacterium]|nr:ribonucleoside triphosphate reductase [Patescibacteria group bacterium]